MAKRNAIPMPFKSRDVTVQAPTDRDPAPATPKVTLNSNRFQPNVNPSLPGPVGAAPTPTLLDTSNSRKHHGSPYHDNSSDIDTDDCDENGGEDGDCEENSRKKLSPLAS